MDASSDHATDEWGNLEDSSDEELDEICELGSKAITAEEKDAIAQLASLESSAKAHADLEAAENATISAGSAGSAGAHAADATDDTDAATPETVTTTDTIDGHPIVPLVGDIPSDLATLVEDLSASDMQVVASVV